MGNERKRRKCTAKTSNELKENEKDSFQKPTRKKTSRPSTARRRSCPRKSSSNIAKEEVTHCGKNLEVGPCATKIPTVSPCPRKSSSNIAKEKVTHYGKNLEVGPCATKIPTAKRKCKRNEAIVSSPLEIEGANDAISSSKFDENSSSISEKDVDKRNWTSEKMQTPKHKRIKRNAAIKGHTQSPDSGIVANDNSSESEWEEVQERDSAAELDDYNPEIPKEGVEITINTPNMWLHRRKRKKEIDLADIIRRQVNRFKKDIQVSLHKVHLLCLLAHGQFLNSLLREHNLLALMLSVIPLELHKPKSMTLETLDKFVTWFCHFFQFDHKSQQWGPNVKDGLEKSIQEYRISSVRDFNLLFVLTLRTLGYEVRLCLSLHPLPLKLLSKPKKQLRAKQGSYDRKSKPCVEKESDSSTKMETNNNRKQKETYTKRSVRKRAAKSAKKSKVVMSSDSDSDKSSGDVFEIDKSATSYKSKNSLRKVGGDLSEDSEDDFVATQRKESHKFDFPIPDVNKTSLVKTKKKCPNRKILSSDSSDEVNVSVTTTNAENRSAGIEYWVEVYTKESGKLKWVCVDCIKRNIGNSYKIEEDTLEPIAYVLAFDNDNCVKDVTKRYASKWMTHTRKMRIDEAWWDESLEPFLSRKHKRDKTEDKHLDEIMANMPLPTTIGEYKDHPLYVLKRHLLKFQAIYPPDAPPLGYIRNEVVYARECVHTLHSRETWLKQARVVRVGEEPYKIVKARPKWNRATGEIQTDLPLQVFGKWQTDEYVPPVAKDGKVPRNEYGNVELFQPSMLPIGTVHLQIPGLNRVARKLGIDCCPALVGFDGNWGNVHPVFDGWIVCEEFQDVLIAAWEEDQENQQKRQDEKREKRIYENWKCLIKGLLIREKLKHKYSSKVC